MNTAEIDVLGLGCVAVDDLLYVAAFPPADGKAQVHDRGRQCGGLTATALVAAARLGARCAFAGVLGTDPLSVFAADCLAREGVDLTHMVRRDDARPIHSTIVVDEARQTRCIFFDLEGAVGASPDQPAEEVIRRARVLFVDPLGMPGMVRAARIARQAGRPIVADFESDESPLFPELLDLVDHLILSDDFARRLTGAADPAAAAQALWTGRREAVVITCGSAGCWWLTAACEGRPRHLPAFAVPAIDTTGCGDVFHGAYAAALARGLPLEERLRFAAAAAALKATRRGGQAGIPTREVVEQFLLEHPS
jgi:sulfofructose kinase